jgi:hypothetical protein
MHKIISSYSDELVFIIDNSASITSKMSNGGSASDPVLTESLLSTGIVTDFGSNPEDPSPSASPNWTPEAEDKERDRDRSFDDSIVSKGLLRNTDNETVVNSMRRNVKRVRDIIQDPDMDSRLEKLFKLHQRGTTWQMEVYCGVIQFISCVYVLPVVPLQLGAAGFQIGDMISITVSNLHRLSYFYHSAYIVAYIVRPFQCS